MKSYNNIIGGLAGAVALNIIHQLAKQISHNAPRVNLIGEEAVQKGLEAIKIQPPKGDNLFAAALAGDLISNTLYYSTIGIGDKKNLLMRGAIYGSLAGIGALTLTKPLGLSDAPVTKTNSTKLMTVGWYLLGGIITALTIKGLNKA